MNLSIPDKEYKDLLEQSRMLGVIGCYVEEFCREEDTTLIGVVRLLSEYHQLKSDHLYEKLEELKNKFNNEY